MIHRLATTAGIAVLLPLASALACSNSDTEGVSVGIELDAPTRTTSQANASTWVTDLGYHVQLDAAYLATGTVEIMPCAAQALNLLALFAESTAHAHAVGSPTRLGIPVVESLLATGDARVHVGTMDPPPGSYCVVRYGVNAADRDAVGLPADINMVGISFFVRGLFSKEGGAQQAFEVSSSKSFQVDLPVGQVALSTGGAHTAVLGVRKVADAWFNGIDFANATQDQIADGALANLQRSLSAVQQ